MKITESKLRALIQECITEAMFHIQQSERVRANNEKHERLKNNICDAIMNVIVEEYGSPIVRKESIAFTLDSIMSLIYRGERRLSQAQ